MADECDIAIDAGTYRRAQCLLATFGSQLRANEASTIVQIMLAHRHQERVAPILLDAMDEIDRTYNAP